MKRILICDDALAMRLIMKKQIENMGHEVVGQAQDGEEAVAMYKELKPDVVTMDITMPKKTGIEALKDIVAYDNSANVIMVSAMGQEERVKESILSGAKNFVVKPFTPEKLEEVINKIK